MSEESNNTEMNAISKMLNYALLPSFNHKGEQDGVIDLSPEMIWSAMNYIKSNPNISIENACEYAIDEWIK